MNILFTPSDSNGTYSGSTMSMVALVSLLHNKFDHNVLVALPYEGDVVEQLDAVGVRSVIFKSYNWSISLNEKRPFKEVVKDELRDVFTQLNALRLARIIRENNIDIVHINTSVTWIGALAALATGTPFIWHIREFLEEDHGLTIRHQQRGYRLMARANRLIAISQSIYDKYEPIFGADKLVMIENGIEPAKYAYSEHEVLKNATVRFLMVGGSEGKGHKVAIRACLQLLERGFENFELVVLGHVGDSYRESLDVMLTSVPNAAEHFSFPGPTADTPVYYRNTDIFLMCSRAEAFGRVTVEAMMSGCLVIGANTAGTVELVQDGATGYLFESGNSEELAAKIEYALQHRDEAQRVAKAGQSYMLQNMTAENNAAEVNALYAEVLRGGGIPG